MVVVTTEQVSANFDESVVILSMHTGSYYSLDEVSLFIWNFIQEPHRVAEIRDAILEEYDVDLVQCEEDLLALLDDLADKQLIRVDDKNSSEA